MDNLKNRMGYYLNFSLVRPFGYETYIVNSIHMRPYQDYERTVKINLHGSLQPGKPKSSQPIQNGPPTDQIANIMRPQYDHAVFRPFLL